MTRDLIALIADSGDGDERDPRVLPLAQAALALILEHRGRVLLAADAAIRLPLLFAAAEYAEPVEVETREGRRPAPVIVAPFPAGDGFEDRLLAAEGARSLLAELVDTGVAEVSEGRSVNDALRAWRPAAVLIIGRTERTEWPRVADEQPPRILLSDELEERMRRYRIPPRFEGQPLERHDDALSILASAAADSAARVLSFEDVIAEILGDEESIS